MTIGIVVGATILVRLVWVLLVPTRPVVDFAMYWESARHLVAFGSLDAGFAYMPGYVLLLAGVQALGGGVLAARLLGVVLAGLTAVAVHEIARHLHGRPAALMAGLLFAAWPAGIANAGVLGNDLPAGALVATALWGLVALARFRPRTAALVFGAVMGLGALVRAVLLPLPLLAAPVFLARRCGLRAALGRTALAVLAAFVVLLPWGMRNLRRNGAFSLSDPHGGITALLGANPNTDGAFTFSLYRLFAGPNGGPPLAGDHREADRLAYALALDWTRFEPRFAAGLAIGRAQRLFDREQALLYWPVFRPGVLPPGPAAFFDRWQRVVHVMADVFGFLVLAGVVAGVAVLAIRRRWFALAVLLPSPLALTAAYVTHFGEARYRLPIEVLALPLAGLGLCWGVRCLFVLARGVRPESPLRREAALALVALVTTALAGRGLPALGTHLRTRYRWVVTACKAPEGATVCKWARITSSAPSGDHDHVVMSLDPISPVVTALEVGTPRSAPLSPGPHVLVARVQLERSGAMARVSLAAPGAPAGDPTLLHADQRTIEVPIEGPRSNTGGPLRLHLTVTGGSRATKLSLSSIEVKELSPTITSTRPVPPLPRPLPRSTPAPPALERPRPGPLAARHAAPSGCLR